jgi:hypothetical protein
VADTSDEITSEFMLTTVDNPYDPFTQWDEWFAWDLHAGYNTPGLLARLAYVPDDLPLGDQHLAIQDAIDEICKENATGVHMMVKRGDVPKKM